MKLVTGPIFAKKKRAVRFEKRLFSFFFQSNLRQKTFELAGSFFLGGLLPWFFQQHKWQLLSFQIS